MPALDEVFSVKKASEKALRTKLNIGHLIGFFVSQDSSSKSHSSCSLLLLFFFCNICLCLFHRIHRFGNHKKMMQ